MQPDEIYAQTAQDSLSLAAENEFEALLNEASDYANDAYYSNVEGNFEQTLEYVDSAMSCLNAHYKRYAQEPQRYMSLRGEGEPGNYPGGMIFSIRTFMSFWISGMRRLSLFLR